jgi:hypothetical protein
MCLSDTAVNETFTKSLCYVDRERITKIDIFEAVNNCHFTTVSASLKRRYGFHRIEGSKAEVKQVAVYINNTHRIIHKEATASSELQPQLHTVPQEAVKLAKFVKPRPLRCYL